jgi:hypothetical protein
MAQTVAIHSAGVLITFIEIFSLAVSLARKRGFRRIPPLFAHRAEALRFSGMAGGEGRPPAIQVWRAAKRPPAKTYTFWRAIIFENFLKNNPK